MLKEELKMQIRKQTAGYVTTALSLVAGLAWNDAVKSLIEIFFPLNTSGVLIKFIYAIIITLVVVILSTYLLKSSEKTTETLK
ncbi:MAG: DUF5654 family protein [Candidatus Paceibacterota bacterium]|jgi:ABC-type maltose transport system permease subunit